MPKTTWTAQDPLLTNDVTVSTDVIVVSGETLQLYYNNAGTKTSDAGQAAGTAVTATFDKGPIFNTTADRVATNQDSSVSGIATIFTTELGFNSKMREIANNPAISWATKLTNITSGLSNGQYVIDYENGVLYGVKATTGTSFTVGYNTRGLQVNAAGGTTDSNITQVGGDTVPDHGAAVVAGTVPVSFEAKDFDGSSLPNAVDEGDAIRPAATLNGVVYSFLVSDDGTWSPLDNSSQTLKNTTQNPIYTHHGALLQLDVTNETNATTNRYFDVTGYEFLLVQFEKTGGTDSVTFTIEASMEDNGTAASSAIYQDISQYGTESLTASATAASYTADVTLRVNVKGFKFINLKTVSAGGANDADYSLFARVAY